MFYTKNKIIGKWIKEKKICIKMMKLKFYNKI